MNELDKRQTPSTYKWWKNRTILTQTTEWISHLPLADIPNAGQALLARMVLLNKTAMSVHVRRQVIQLFIPALNFIQSNTIDAVPNPYFPLNKKTVPQPNLPRLLWKELAVSWSFIPLSNKKSNKYKQAQHATIGMDILHCLALSYFQVYRQLPTSFWKQINELYKFTTLHKIQKISVDKITDTSSTTFNHALKRLTLLITADPPSFSRKELQYIWEATGHWARDCHMSTLPQDSLDKGWLIIGSEEDIQPHVPDLSLPGPQLCLAMDCTALISRSRAETYQGSVQKTKSRWIRKALSRWSNSLNIDFPLQKQNKSIELCVGLNNAFSLATLQHSSSSSPVHITKQTAQFLPGKSREQHLATKNPWLPITEVNVDAEKTDYSVSSTAQTMNWTSTRVSAAEMHLKSQKNASFKLRVGELVFLSDSQSDTAWLAKLTAMKMSKDLQTTIICSLISLRFSPALIILEKSKSTAFILESGATADPLKHIICSPGIVSSGDNIRILNPQGKLQELHILQIFEQTEGYCNFLINDGTHTKLE